MLSWPKRSSPIRSGISEVKMTSVIVRGVAEDVAIFTPIVSLLGKHPSPNRHMFM